MDFVVQFSPSSLGFSEVLFSNHHSPGSSPSRFMYLILFSARYSAVLGTYCPPPGFRTTVPGPVGHALQSSYSSYALCGTCSPVFKCVTVHHSSGSFSGSCSLVMVPLFSALHGSCSPVFIPLFTVLTALIFFSLQHS